MTRVPERKLFTVEDFLAQHERVELIRGTLVQEAEPTVEHSSELFSDDPEDDDA